ncbi:hypothetical protein GDO78_022123 [Eleutherodactylus coqui]|uniref:Uncharacterized protein n=1 Tax=Eleutherodactylus coqui TaxID=57060 RepID=A0A8J6JS68_ELECQ|nr:hypothetical protein GDO78_022123 [Eleutherodactylus coqui]
MGESGIYYLWLTAAVWNYNSQLAAQDVEPSIDTAALKQRRLLISGMWCSCIYGGFSVTLLQLPLQVLVTSVLLLPPGGDVYNVWSNHKSGITLMLPVHYHCVIRSLISSHISPLKHMQGCKIRLAGMSAELPHRAR